MDYGIKGMTTKSVLTHTGLSQRIPATVNGIVTLAVPLDALRKSDTLCCPGAREVRSITNGSVPTETQECKSMQHRSLNRDSQTIETVKLPVHQTLQSLLSCGIQW